MKHALQKLTAALRGTGTSKGARPSLLAAPRGGGIRNKRSWFLAAFAVTMVTAGVTLAGGALATAPGGVVPTPLGSGTTAVPLKFSVPKVVTVTEKYRVKTKSGKFVTRTRQVKRTIDSPVVACSATTPCDLIQQRLTIQPGGFSGWHSHPGLVIVIVTAGTLTRYEADCSKTTYAPGQTFIEYGRDHAGFVRNEGSTPAELVQTYVNPANADPRIDQPAPANCGP